MKLEVISPGNKKVMSTIKIEHTIFPDGQRHIMLDTPLTLSKNMHYCITAGIKCADDLFDIALVKDVLPWGAWCALQVEYLMGARMDKQIDDGQPCTARVVGDLIDSMGFSLVAVMDAHSERALSYVTNSTNILPKSKVATYLERFDSHDTVIISPDAGAIERVENLADGHGFDIVQCYKKRNQKNGRLSDFSISAPTDRVDGKVCVILDDICDGGRTFTELAGLLKQAGAIQVHLWVTHGIFSNGRDIKHLDSVTAMNDWLEEEE